MKKFFLSIFLVYFSLSGFSQKTSKSSVEIRGEKLFMKDMQLSLNYADSLLNSKNKKHLIYANLLKGRTTSYASHLDTSLVYLREALRLSEKENKIDFQIRSQLDLSILEIYRANFKEAESLIKNSDSLNKLSDNKELKAKALNSKCMLNWYTLAQYSVCSQYLFDALEIHNDISTETTKVIYLSLSELLFEAGFYESGFEYLEEVVKQSNLENNNLYLGWSSIIHGLLLYDAEGVKKLKESIEIGKRSHNKFMEAYASVNLGRLYVSDGLQKDERGHLFFTKGRMMFKKYGNKTALVDAHLKLANFFSFNKKHKDSALYYIDKIEHFSKQHDIHSLDYYIYKAYFNTYKQSGDYKRAVEYEEKREKEWEKIFGVEINNTIASSDRRYKLKSRELKLLQQEITLQKIKRNQSKLYVGLASLSLLSILLWVVFSQRQKRKNQEIVTLKREHQIKSLELLIEGEEKERLRISKELHDGVNGNLSAIKYKLTSMQEMSNKIIGEAVDMIDISCKQVRAISHNLVPPSLENFDIIEATETFCQNVNAIHKPQINFQYIGEAPKINKKDEINIFRIIQELVTNSIKHANASEIDVQLSCREKQIQITVEDNGKGFEKDNIKNKGIGLDNIQSRADYLKATLDLLSNEKGTSCTVEIDANKLNDN